MPKSILFDLDGTLTDSGEGIMNCAAPALEHFGIPIPQRDALRVFVGPPLHDTFRQFGVPEDQVDEAIRIYRSRYVPIGKFENTPYPGIRELLEKLRAQGHRLFVATSKPEDMSVEILEHFDLARFFNRICGASLDRSRSSKDAVIAYLLQQHGAGDQMVMVGDTVFDILGAAAHGIPAVGVAWGYGSVEEMKKAGAAAIATTMDELFRILQAL
ncbi:MAG: HAD family hydrolase [Candidatus Faecousia sp.]|nr:HAD family hydrolase [Clostridiales bacterium]MDY6181148.1 HAD family hydrolase [Candidatus Faecousia sp.]